MAKQATTKTAKAGPVARTRAFLQEVKIEMSKVTWPTGQQLKASTQVVLLMLVIVAAVIYAYDIVFQGVVVWLLRAGA